jgi:AraC-like DNA-binding protein
MGRKVDNNFFTLPASIGEGFVRMEELPNNLSALIMNFRLNTDMHFEQSKSKEELYSLRFEEIVVPDSFVTQIDSEYLKDTRHQHTSAFLVCNLFDVGYFVHKGTHMKCITIQMTKDWLAKYMRMDIYDEILQHYISMKTASLHMEPLDSEYKRIIAEINEVNQNHPTHITLVQNRIMALIERFFNNLYEKRNNFKSSLKANMSDIEMIRKIEQIITADLTGHCPTINELARIAAMSPSKLKQLFKDIYGKPIYQYYQFNRMQKARSMLLSNKFSVKEVGMSLGYVNLSSFSAAFRKEFKVLPSKLLRA